MRTLHRGVYQFRGDDFTIPLADYIPCVIEYYTDQCMETTQQVQTTNRMQKNSEQECNPLSA